MKAYIGCEKFHGEPKFYVADCDECRSDLVTLPGTDIYFSDATVEWLSSQTAEGKALARLEAARQEGVIDAYSLHSPALFCDQWQTGTYVIAQANKYEKGATAAAVLTAAADYADSLRVPPLPDVGSMSIEAMAAELNSYGAKVGLLCASNAFGAKYSCWILASGDCYAEGRNHWTMATRLALTAARQQQK